jgi:flagellar basal body P-ring formation protein FlgA
MIRPIIAIAALLLALAGPFADAAAAQTATPTLRSNVTVSSDLVRIGDLIDNAGPVADVPIFRAPDLGTRGAVTTARIVEAIRPHQLIDIDTRGLAEVIVTRASRAITAQEISARIAAALSEQFKLGEPRNIAVNFDHDARTLHVEPNAAGELQVLGLAYDPRTARFDVTFDLPSSAALNRQPTRYTGTAFETVTAVTVERPVEHGEVLKASDLTVLRRPKTDGGLVADIDAAVGRAARRALRPGQPIRDADLMKPEIVQRNDTVTIVYEAPGLVLTLRGQAQDAGALGDTINVLNVQSKRVVQGVVAGPGRVNVTVQATRLVENAPAPVQHSAPAVPEKPENPE